jgi:GxxExxY protein
VARNNVRSDNLTRNNSELLHIDLTQIIIGSAFEVYKVLGYGFLEKVYKKSLIYELKLNKLKVIEEYPMKVRYKTEVIGNYYADVYVDNKVIIEVKTEERYYSIQEAQLLNYLKATGTKIGLLINFGRFKCEFKRLIF